MWGQVIDLSVHEVGLFNKLGTEQYGLAGHIKTRATNFGPPPGGIWRCRDGLLDIGAHSAHHWDVFVDLLGRPDVLSDPIYRDRVMRVQLFDLLTGIIADLLADVERARVRRGGTGGGLAVRSHADACPIRAGSPADRARLLRLVVPPGHRIASHPRPSLHLRSPDDHLPAAGAPTR